MSTDFERTIRVLKADLADPTADAAAETLLVAREVGGPNLDRRLDALIENRVIDVQGRKDPRSRQAGVRCAKTSGGCGCVVILASGIDAFVTDAVLFSPTGRQPQQGTTPACEGGPR
jgi:hypothetical protein